MEKLYMWTAMFFSKTLPDSVPMLKSKSNSRGIHTFPFWLCTYSIDLYSMCLTRIESIWSSSSDYGVLRYSCLTLHWQHNKQVEYPWNAHLVLHSPTASQSLYLMQQPLTDVCETSLSLAFSPLPDCTRSECTCTHLQRRLATLLYSMIEVFMNSIQKP